MIEPDGPMALPLSLINMWKTLGLQSGNSMGPTRKANQSESLCFHLHAATIHLTGLKIQKVCLIESRLLVDAIEEEVKVPLVSLTMTKARAGEVRGRGTEGVMSRSPRLTVSIVMFLDSEEEEVLATVVAVDDQVRDASVRLETVKGRECPMEDRGRLLKSLTRRWMITGAVVLLKARMEMAQALRRPPPDLSGAMTLT